MACAVWPSACAAAWYVLISPSRGRYSRESKRAPLTPPGCDSGETPATNHPRVPNYPSTLGYLAVVAAAAAPCRRHLAATAWFFLTGPPNNCSDNRQNHIAYLPSSFFLPQTVIHNIERIATQHDSRSHTRTRHGKDIRSPSRTSLAPLTLEQSEQR